MTAAPNRGGRSSVLVKPRLQARELWPGAHLLAWPEPYLGTVNGYYMVRGREAVLIDTGWGRPADWRDFLQFLEETGNPPPSAVFVTHGHIDHYGMMPQLAKEFRPELWLPEGELIGPGSVARLDPLLEDPELFTPEMRSELKGWRERIASGEEALEVSQRWSDGGTLDLAGEPWQVVITPGHSAAHACLWQPERRLLISGDHVLPDTTPNLTPRPAQPGDPGAVGLAGEADVVGEYLNSLTRVERLSPRIALPGHGRVITDPQARIEVIKQHHGRRLADIENVLERHGEASFLSIVREMTWMGSPRGFDRLDGLNRAMAIGEARVHIEHLRRTGRLRVRDAGTETYSLAG